MYEWKVATKCPSGTYSSFSASITFTTPAQRISDDPDGEFVRHDSPPARRGHTKLSYKAWAAPSPTLKTLQALQFD